ncbi:MAG TPA: hypothetical protein VMW42_02570 [Desulfatiglandales bacterium]|nr:hypothetical protein [Desulfatiglandales bacterium]
MVKLKFVIISIGVLIAGICLSMYLSRSEEKKVRKQFDQLSKWVSKDHNEDHFTMAGKIKNIGELCVDDFTLTIHDSSPSGRYSPKEISGLAARLRFPFSKLSLKFNDLQIEFPDKKKAKVIATAIFSGNLKEGEIVDEIFEVEYDLIKLENKWLFISANVVEVLEK